MYLGRGYSSDSATELSSIKSWAEVRILQEIFSLNIDLGFVVREGQIVGRVKDTMVAGNVYQALKQVVALGNDARWSGSCHAPSLIVDGLSVVS